LIVTSGGLGPTPDDLTREAIARVLGVVPSIDPGLERWLRDLWASRGLPFPESNLKQAWLVPGAEALPNPNGTAPGWWVEDAATVFVALPGPPREMRPMWAGHVVPRLRARGLGADRVAETLRLTGIGESAVADLLGDDLLRGTRPSVATYARIDAVDVRVWATGDAQSSARAIVDAGLASVEPILRPYVFARGDESWVDAIGTRIGDRHLACLEVGTAGQLAALLGVAPWLRRAEVLNEVVDAKELATHCSEARVRAGTHVAVAVMATDRGDDLAVDVAVDVDGLSTTSRHTAFRGGDIGRRRAANIACAELWTRLAD
jgi:nicotinamide-nucleotide amidase